MIDVTVKLLGPAADLAGCDTLQYALEPPATLETLTELLCAKHPRLRANASYLRFAVNGEYARPEHPLSDGDEVGVIPPVSGGQAELVRLTREAISAAALTPLITHLSCGGIVTFEGVIRIEQSPEGTLEALEYSAYEEMTVRLMQRIREDALDRFEIHEAALVHRLGRLEIGECSIAIAVSAAHREAAFDACRWIIEAVKKDVPIWKKELWTGGRTTWVGLSHSADTP